MNTVADIVKPFAKIAKKALGSKVRGYAVELKLGSGPRFYITLVGAHGDITALHLLKTKLTPVLDKELRRQGVPAKIGISASNADAGDLTVEVELRF